jgi:hypothetical protein
VVTNNLPIVWVFSFSCAEWDGNMITTGENVGIRKKQILDYFKVLAQHLPADAEINIIHGKRWCKNCLSLTRKHCILMVSENVKLHQNVGQLRRN